MTLFLYVLITLLGVASYVVGIRQMFQNIYTPSVFSRIIWALLAFNSFVSIVLSQGSMSSILLGGISLGGNIAICLVSFWKGTKKIGRLEYICLGLLGLSAVIWALFRTPLLNLAISLFAHFIGGLPTYKKIWMKPKSESTGFWALFFFASILSIFATATLTLKAIIFPLYFTLFDGSMFFLSLRRKRENKESP